MLTPEFLASLVCKFCGRSADQVSWARVGEGLLCADCRGIMRRSLRGSKEEKQKRQKDIEDACKTEEGKQHYRDTTLAAWLAVSESERSGYGSKKNFDVAAPLRSTVDAQTRKGFIMKQILGLFWPQPVFEADVVRRARARGRSRSLN